MCNWRVFLNPVTYIDDKFYMLVPCLPLTNLDNGVTDCLLGDDNVPSYEDICSFTCNTGYELTGSDTRTCQSDGSWSGSDDACRRGNKIMYALNFLQILIINLCFSSMFIIEQS